MTDANSIDTTGVRGSCGWCAGSLSHTTSCRSRGRRRTRSAPRSACATSSAVTQPSGARSRRRLKSLVDRPSLWRPASRRTTGRWRCAAPPARSRGAARRRRRRCRAGSGPSGRRRRRACSRRWGATPGSIRWRGRSAACRAATRACSAPCGRAIAPIECRNGHCGVDLGGEIWGEHVHAVHDGVVDYVQRGANPDHGGTFVRISHRDGTVFTQYFHLAAIPRGLERGRVVKAGDVIGLLGDTGVKESAPHLHFAISVRPSQDGPRAVHRSRAADRAVAAARSRRRQRGRAGDARWPSRGCRSARRAGLAGRKREASRSARQAAPRAATATPSGAAAGGRRPTPSRPAPSRRRMSDGATSTTSAARVCGRRRRRRRAVRARRAGGSALAHCSEACLRDERAQAARSRGAARRLRAVVAAPVGWRWSLVGVGVRRHCGSTIAAAAIDRAASAARQLATSRRRRSRSVYGPRLAADRRGLDRSRSTRASWVYPLPGPGAPRARADDRSSSPAAARARQRAAARRALRRRPGRRAVGRARLRGARRRRRARAARAAPTSPAAATCASRTSAAWCSRSTSTSPRSRAASRAARTSRPATSSAWSATPAQRRTRARAPALRALDPPVERFARGLLGSDAADGALAAARARARHRRRRDVGRRAGRDRRRHDLAAAAASGAATRALTPAPAT